MLTIFSTLRFNKNREYVTYYWGDVTASNDIGNFVELTVFLKFDITLRGYYIVQLVGLNFKCRRGPKLDECMTYHK